MSSESINIVLTGFMGSGKSTVGRIVAQRLDRPFVDMDGEIEARAGKTIAHIFSQDGEAAFRRMEAALCRELAAQRGLVIATGGGALTFEENRRALAQGGLLICLDVTAEQVVQRLAGRLDRPLLLGEDRRERVEELLLRRAADYAAIPHHIVTDGVGVEDVAEGVVRLLEPIRLPVHTPMADYDILVGPRLLDDLGRTMVARGLAGPVAVVTNERIAPLYGERAIASLQGAGLQAHLCTMPDGEVHKTLATVGALYGQFVAAGLERRSTVVALGGGVVGDVAGFAAATFLRGISFVQVPTTLLAMVDASIGGKTGVDLPQGKNLVGAFKPPAIVLADTETLRSLPEVEFRAGLAEVVKHGLIGAPRLFERMERGEVASVEGWLPDAIQVKVDVVQEDPLEMGRRAVLNLGHTFAHAIERVSDYTWRHGEAVAVGLVAAARLSTRLGVCPEALPEQIAATVSRLGLPTGALGFDPDAWLTAMETDKKRQQGVVRFILLRAVGDVFIAPEVPQEAVAHVLRDMVQA